MPEDQASGAASARSKCSRSKQIARIHGPKSSEAGILVQNFDLGKANLPQQVQLEHQRPGRILFLDVGEDLISVGFIIQAASGIHHSDDACWIGHSGIELSIRSKIQTDPPDRKAT